MELLTQPLGSEGQLLYLSGGAIDNDRFSIKGNFHSGDIPEAQLHFPVGTNSPTLLSRKNTFTEPLAIGQYRQPGIFSREYLKMNWGA